MHLTAHVFPYSSSTTSIKVVSVPRRADDQTGLPATTLIFDEKTGQSRAVLNARSLTAVRTAQVYSESTSFDGITD